MPVPQPRSSARPGGSAPTPSTASTSSGGEMPVSHGVRPRRYIQVKNSRWKIASKNRLSISTLPFAIWPPSVRGVTPILQYTHAEDATMWGSEGDSGNTSGSGVSICCIQQCISSGVAVLHNLREVGTCGQLVRALRGKCMTESPCTRVRVPFHDCVGNPVRGNTS